jgi:hypothetical protein
MTARSRQHMMVVATGIQRYSGANVGRQSRGPVGDPSGRVGQALCPDLSTAGAVRPDDEQRMAGHEEVLATRLGAPFR